jgi:1,4-alpha-glucan branching enzyme
MWPMINAAQRRIEDIVARAAGTKQTPAMAPLARELLLLESSDWPFLVTTGQAREYAELRFTQHVERFEQLATQIEDGRADEALVADLWERDKLFPDIELQDFAAREGSASPPAGAIR